MRTFATLLSIAATSLAMTTPVHAQSLNPAELAQALHQDIPAQGNAAVAHIESELRQSLRHIQPELAPVPFLNAQPEIVQPDQHDQS
jgi:hypothetical protein